MRTIYQFFSQYSDNLISIVAIVVSVISAIKQRKLEKTISSKDKRSEIVCRFKDDEILNETDVKIYFPKCMELFESFERANIAVGDAESMLNEYLNSLAIDNDMSVKELKQQFQIEENKYEETDNEKFIEFCKGKAITYMSELKNEWFKGDYYTLSKNLHNAQLNRKAEKEKLENKMCELCR